MYAVVSTGGKQYRVEPGRELVVERLAADPGASVTFDRVLLVGDGEAVTIGTPIVSGASVSATVIGEARGPKLIVFKFKQKVKYRRTTGHRQHLTRVRIDEISADGRRATAPKPDEAAAAEAGAPTRPARAPRSRKPKAEAEPKPEADAKAEVAEPNARAARPKGAARPKATAKGEGEAEEGEPRAAEATPRSRRRGAAKKAETAEE